MDDIRRLDELHCDPFTDEQGWLGVLFELDTIGDGLGLSDTEFDRLANGCPAVK